MGIRSKALEISSQVAPLLVGVYGTAPFLGRIVDARGPRILLAGAFVMLLAGYSGIRYLYNDAEGSMSTSWLTFCALVFFSFMTGVGGDGGLTSSINVTAKNFPERAVRMLRTPDVSV